MGLAVPAFDALFMRAALAFGFATLGLSEIVAITTITNARSRRVMERLGMTRNPADDFDHPNIATSHPLRRHLLCRVRRDEWTKAGGEDRR